MICHFPHRLSAVVATVLLGVALVSPASGQDAVRDAGVLGEKLDASAAASRAAAAPVQGKLTSAQVATLKQLGTDFSRTGDTAALQRGWQRFIVSAKPAEGDVDALIQLVLSESYQESSRDLRLHTEKAIAKKPRQLATSGTRSSDGIAPGDDSQLANVNLQNSLQKQQPAMQTLSNMAKSMHDTAKAIINKVGG